SPRDLQEGGKRATETLAPTSANRGSPGLNGRGCPYLRTSDRVNQVHSGVARAHPEVIYECVRSSVRIVRIATDRFARSKESELWISSRVVRARPRIAAFFSSHALKRCSGV